MRRTVSAQDAPFMVNFSLFIHNGDGLVLTMFRAFATSNAYYLISRKNYTYAMPGSWISKALRISRCALVTSVRV